MLAYGGNKSTGPREVASALSAHGGACGRMDFETETFVAHTLRAKHNLTHREDIDTYVAHTLRGEGFDASEDGTGRGTPLVPVGVRSTAPTLTTTYGKQPDSSDTNAGPMLLAMHAPAVHPTMVARSSRGGGQTNTPGHNADETLIAFDTTQITSASNYSNPKAGDPCHPLAAGAHAPAVAFGWQNAAAQGMAVDTISPTLDKSKHPATLAFSGKDYGADASAEIAPTLRAMGHAGSHANGGGQMAVQQAAAVRRLMPSECEALQGFPHGYTAIPWRGKPASECPDGPRYKAVGNSWAVNCARWIGWRISVVEQISGRAAS